MSVTDSKDGPTPSSYNSQSMSTDVQEDENANGQNSTHKSTKSIHSQAEKKTPTKRCKLVIVGDGCCGKTSLLTVFKRCVIERCSMNEELNKYLEDHFRSFCFCFVKDNKKLGYNSSNMTWVDVSHQSVMSTFQR